MGFLRKIKTFAEAPAAFKWIFVKAWFLSAFVKITLVFLPFNRVMKWKGRPGVETATAPDPGTDQYRRWVQSAMRLVALYTPWRSECYTQALTAKIILQQRGLPATIYIGFRKGSAGSYEGHAWLRSYDRIITGNQEIDTYQLHTCYS
jgi:hypothetical protein